MKVVRLSWLPLLVRWLPLPLTKRSICFRGERVLSKYLCVPITIYFMFIKNVYIHHVLNGVATHVCVAIAQHLLPASQHVFFRDEIKWLCCYVFIVFIVVIWLKLSQLQTRISTENQNLKKNVILITTLTCASWKELWKNIKNFRIF